MLEQKVKITVKHGRTSIIWWPENEEPCISSPAFCDNLYATVEDLRELHFALSQFIEDVNEYNRLKGA